MIHQVPLAARILASSEIGFFLTFFLAAAICVVVITILNRLSHWWNCRAAARIPEVRCRKCGYIIAADTSRNCPECGADLRELGVNAASLPPPLYPAGALAAWAVVLAPIAIAAGFWISQKIPLFANYEAFTTIPTGVIPDQGHEAVVKITAKGTRVLAKLNPTQLYLTWYDRTAGNFHWTVDANKFEPFGWRLTKIYWDSKAISAKDDADAIQTLVKLAAEEPNTSPPAALPATLLAELHKFQRARFPTGTIPNESGFPTPAIRYEPWFPYSLAIAFLLWLPLFRAATSRTRNRYRAKLADDIVKSRSVLDDMRIAK